MPYKWEEPEVVIKVDNVTIYHTYKDGENRMSYHFTDLKEDCDEDLNRTWFDVRELKSWRVVSLNNAGASEDELIRRALFEAIMSREVGEVECLT